jgi:hypothetical protein
MRISEDDLTTPTRLAAALAELLPDMARHYAGRLEDPKPETRNDYAFTLSGSRTRLGDATPGDFEIARHEIATDTTDSADVRPAIPERLTAPNPGRAVRHPPPGRGSSRFSR